MSTIIMKPPVFINGKQTGLKTNIYVPTVKEPTYFDCRNLKESEIFEISNSKNNVIKPIMLEPAFL